MLVHIWSILNHFHCPAKALLLHLTLYNNNKSLTSEYVHNILHIVQQNIENGAIKIILSYTLWRTVLNLGPALAGSCQNINK